MVAKKLRKVLEYERKKCAQKTKHKPEKDSYSSKTNKVGETTPKRGEYAGECPRCGSPLVWRKANITGELYRGCTNYDGGCRYQERSY